ncbi:MAG: hypothetical protein NTV26_07760 [Caldiserica bacterium]|nr:hypothetical protein [Caldisericota bacterium]
MAVRLAIIEGNNQVYAYRKDAKEVTSPFELTDLGAQVCQGLVYPPHQSIYGWINFLTGYWREPGAEDIPVPNIEELVAKAEKWDRPVDIATGEPIERRRK